MLTNDELDLLESVKSEKEWAAACDMIKKNHNGYPADWFHKVLASGLARRVLNSFGASDQIQAVKL